MPQPGSDMSTSRVVIVGAGPAGATAALLLAQHGIDTLVVERRVAPSPHPAAHVLSTRTLEIFRELGLEHDVRRLSSRLYELRNIIYATSLTGPELGRITIYDPESTEAQLLQTLSPTRAANLSQHVLGRLLWDQLEACKRVEFRRGSVYQNHRETSDGVEVRGHRPRRRWRVGRDRSVSDRRRRCGQPCPAHMRTPDARPRTSTRDQRSLQRRPAPVSVVAPCPRHLDVHPTRAGNPYRAQLTR